MVLISNIIVSCCGEADTKLHYVLLSSRITVAFFKAWGRLSSALRAILPACCRADSRSVRGRYLLKSRESQGKTT